MKNFGFILVITVLVSVGNTNAVYDISCKDENGNSIDWFYLYKIPRLYPDESSNPLMNKGAAYAYMTEQNTKWNLSSYSINDTQSMPAQTLNLLYHQQLRDQDEIGYVFYNDQAEQVTFTKGHTKGVLIFNETIAIWIVHSIPHYPPNTQTSDHYYINASQLVYGQSMLCVRTTFDALDKIGQQLLYNYPQFYDYHIPKSLYTKYRSNVLVNLINAINGAYVQTPPWYNLNYIQTVNKKYEFLSFSKFTLYDQDLYTGLVAQTLQSDLNVESWNNGQGTISTNCSLDYHVYNIEYLSFDSFNVSFTVHRDHSKWTVTTFGNQTVICVGDVNRQIDQFHRGGGTLCLLNDKNIWSQYYNLIKRTEDCPSRRS